MTDLSRKRRRGDAGAAEHDGGDECASVHPGAETFEKMSGREGEGHGREDRVLEGESRRTPSGIPSEGVAAELLPGAVDSKPPLVTEERPAGVEAASRATQACDGIKKGANQAEAGGGQGGPRTGPKRKVALLLAYNGGGYQGLQKNPDALTIEEVLADAIHSVGGISDDNHGTLQKVWWSRAGRTDKGVHAVGQIVSLKMVLQQTADDASQDEDALARRMQSAINQALRGTAIQVLGIERTTNSFCAHTMCSARQYEYMLPVHCLRRQKNATTDGGDAVGLAEEWSKAQADEATDSAEKACEEGGVGGGGGLCRESEGATAAATAAAGTAAATARTAAAAAAAAAAAGTAAAAAAAACASPLNDEELTRLNATLAQFVGTHSFHNFTDQKTTCDDKSATRYIISACAGQQQQVGGRWFVPLLYKGQSFMLHQIRKMSSMAVLAMRCGGADAIRLALSSPRVATIPRAPACALTLHRCYYSSYEKKRAKDRGSVHFDHAVGQQLAFLTAHIYPHIAQRDAAGDFVTFLNEVDAYKKGLMAE